MPLPALNVPSAAMLRKWALNLGVGLVVFAGVCALINRFAPLPELSAFSDKWNYFTEHKDEFDTLFVGSSRVFRQVSPQAFDSITAAAGQPTRSFNFAQNAMRPPESFYALRRILRLPLPKLRYVFIELMDLKVKLPKGNEETAQLVYWHDLHYTNLVAEELLERGDDFSRRDRFSLITEHYLLWLRQATNHGFGTKILEDALWLPDGDEDDAGKWLPYAGWHPGKEVGLKGAERKDFLEEVDALPDDRTATPLRHTLRDELRELIALVRAKGAEPIFIISPSTSPEENFAETPDGTTLLALNHPKRYPELYNPDFYFDSSHLNPQGAELYTRLVAEHFLASRSGKPVALPRFVPPNAKTD